MTCFLVFCVTATRMLDQSFHSSSPRVIRVGRRGRCLRRVTRIFATMGSSQLGRVNAVCRPKWAQEDRPCSLRIRETKEAKCPGEWK